MPGDTIAGRANAAAVVITGVPGIGKTSVWRAAADSMSPGTVVLRTTGLPGGRPALANLADLLEPVTARRAARLPRPQADALRAGLGLAPAQASATEALLERAVPKPRSGAWDVPLHQTTGSPPPGNGHIERYLRSLPADHAGWSEPPAVLLSTTPPGSQLPPASRSAAGARAWPPRRPMPSKHTPIRSTASRRGGPALIPGPVIGPTLDTAPGRQKRRLPAEGHDSDLG